MDLLLTHGYFLNEDEAEQRVMKPYPPLGILYISAYLKQRGFPVEVYDSTFELKSSFRNFISENRPRVVGIYSNLMTKLTVLEQIRHCKDNGCIAVVGGPDVPQYVDDYLQWGADVAVIGEGEATMAQLLPALLEGDPLDHIEGITFRRDDHSIIRTPPRPLIHDLDTIPFPDRDAIDIGQYVQTWKSHHGMGSLSLICARGCPFTCTWCSRSVYGETHRRRSVKNVVDEIELVLNRYQPDMLWFADDVFTIHHKWFYDFHAEMNRRNLRVPFECISRADRLNEDILKKMAGLGAFRIWFGSESGSQHVLDDMRRRVTVEEIQRITKLAKSFGIETGLFVMLGYPGETLADIEETAEHLKRTGADQFLTTVAYPIKGTEFYDQVSPRIITRTSWSTGTDRNIRFSGRYSDRFYWFANRYLVNEVRQFCLRKNGSTPWTSVASAYLKARLSRIGMEFTKGEHA